MTLEHSNRYSRQERFAGIGQQGQIKLAQSRVLLCGCGALGTVIAERLARSGVGDLRIVDRDWVELSNLQRQSLFTESDAAQSRPKAIAAADALAKINSQIVISPVVEDVTFENIEGLAQDCDLILDGTDNFETRFLINDYCMSKSVPWVHGGCLGASGQVMSIVPGQTACFRCLVPELPPRDSTETCDSAGVLGPAVGLIACWQAAEALKILSGNRSLVAGGLIVLDSWNTESRVVQLNPSTDCQTCQKHNYEFLSGEIRSDTTILCGKNAVQIESPRLETDALGQIASRLREIGDVKQNAFFVRLTIEAYTLTIFKGGRTVVEGTTSVAEARSVLSRTLGA